MALSKLALTSSMLLAQGVMSEMLQFPIYDSTDRPTDFKDGLLSYVKVSRDYNQGPPLKQFLVCTSCTISYIFGEPDDFASVKAEQEMTFKDGGEPVTVKFVQQDMQLYNENDQGEEVPHNWTMDIGYISKAYQSLTYFDHFEENMLGLAPMISEDQAIMDRQFLYKFSTTGDQVGLGLLESYAFNGGSKFVVGGSAADYETLVCEGGANDEGVGFQNSGVTQEGAISEGDLKTNFVKNALYYSGRDLMLKIQNYVPPMKEELENQVLAVDTWRRELVLPTFFYNYFMQTFMIPAYTCDKLQASDLQYPGLDDTYSCYCNNGDYHTMPQINLEMSGKDFQWDLDPATYMYLPYLNYTVPMSLCILGLEAADTNRVPSGQEFVSLGQRAISGFPFYAIFDRATGNVQLELGGATQMGGSGTVGIQIAISVCIVIILFVMLVYLIVLRRNRIKAEEWLEQHKSTLFSHAANLKTEEEILEALVKSKDLHDLMENRNPTTPVLSQNNFVGNSSPSGNGQLLGDNESDNSKRTSSTTKRPHVKKEFSNEQ